MKSVCVFCGSSSGVRPEYARGAEQLGVELARRGLCLVYGGSNVGLMGRVADGALGAGGEVVGIMPTCLEGKEITHPALTRLEIVGTMQERKRRMAELADAFVAMPGGFGTLDELLEILTDAQLGMHAKPTGILNLQGYFDAMLQFLDHCSAERFVHPDHRAMILASTEPAALLDAFAGYAPPTVQKWVDRRMRG